MHLDKSFICRFFFSFIKFYVYIVLYMSFCCLRYTSLMFLFLCALVALVLLPSGSCCSRTHCSNIRYTRFFTHCKETRQTTQCHRITVPWRLTYPSKSGITKITVSLQFDVHLITRHFTFYAKRKQSSWLMSEFEDFF